MLAFPNPSVVINTTNKGFVKLFDLVICGLFYGEMGLEANSIPIILASNQFSVKDFCLLIRGSGHFPTDSIA